MNYFKTSKKLKGTTIIISLLIFLSMFMSVCFVYGDINFSKSRNGC